MINVKRQLQLVAREGVIGEILNDYDFPTESHRSIIELVYQETLDEMRSLGLRPLADDDIKKEE